MREQDLAIKPPSQCQTAPERIQQVFHRFIFVLKDEEKEQLTRQARGNTVTVAGDNGAL